MGKFKKLAKSGFCIKMCNTSKRKKFAAPISSRLCKACMKLENENIIVSGSISDLNESIRDLNMTNNTKSQISERITGESLQTLCSLLITIIIIHYLNHYSFLNSFPIP